MFKFIKKTWKTLSLILGSCFLTALIIGLFSSAYFLVTDKLK